MICNKSFISIGASIGFGIIFGTAPTGAALDNALIQSMDEHVKLVDAHQHGENQSEGGKHGRGHHGEGECAVGGMQGRGHYYERRCGDGKRGNSEASGVKGNLSGEQVYRQTCFSCHATGVQNAPRFGDKAAWAPLLKEGQPIVTAHGWVGQRGMPPRGGRADLSLEEFTRAVAYMA